MVNEPVLLDCNDGFCASNSGTFATTLAFVVPPLV